MADDKAIDAVEVAASPVSEKDLKDVHGQPTFLDDKDHVSHADGKLNLDNEKHADEIQVESVPEYPQDDNIEEYKEDDIDHKIIRSGADAAAYLLPMRDDHDPALTFRSLFLATGLSCFQAVMYQIYIFKPTNVTIGGTFIVLIAYFVGNFWAWALPRGDKLEAKWRAEGGQGKLPFKIRFWKVMNPREWGLKEHAICSITATSASQAAPASQVFAAQDLFYNLPLSAVNVILSTISIGLFGYGLCGIMRPFAVWHVEAVYWYTIPIVKTLQALHWQDLKNSKPLRYFWYAFGSMFAYEWIPAYVFPWLNSVSVPCLASMNAQGETAETLTNIFGGADTNEGLGMFSLSFDWQYITSFQTSLPLKLQLHQGIGLLVCMMAMLGIYYSNTWDALSQPFMSTNLMLANGTTYPTSEVFVDGILDEAALEQYGVPQLSATFAFGIFMANAAIGALIVHVIIFWGKDILKTIKNSYNGKFNDPHHEHMTKHYKEAPWWWYVGVLIVAFICGLIVILTQDVHLSPGFYIFSLVLGSILSPFSTILFSRYGNGIATNNLSKMIAGMIAPGDPVGNMYFACFSHNVINDAVQLSNDLKLGEYLKIPPRVMFLTQIWGTVVGGFINYVVMISIVNNNRDLLLNGNGDSAWSGATMQAYNTNAASWALSSYLYKVGAPYAAVPMGLAAGAILVLLHRAIVWVIPKIKGFDLNEINMPQFIQYAGYIPLNQAQTCVILSWTIAGFAQQWYVRNYYPRIFRDYAYLVTAAWDGAALTVLFILSFAVFGAGGIQVPMPIWWGNWNVATGYPDHCPMPSS